MSTGWDSNMLKKLKALVGKGLSTAEMGKKLGMSKNAVVGKLNRLGWNAKATESAPKKSAKAEPAKKTAAKKPATKVVAKKAVKKAAPVKPAKKVVEKKSVKSAKVAEKKVPVKNTKTAPKTEKTVKKEKAVKEVKPVVKTKPASKKTKKDLALHELLIQHALQMANLKSNQCRWPIGDPDSDNFHFCGETVFAGKPYCYEHCRQAYQFTPPKKK